MIDVQELLIPIADSEPTGCFLKYDPIYDEILQFKQEDDPQLSQGVWETKLKKANWPELEKICIFALQKKSKDLQIAVWLTEAWINISQWDGLNRGIQLIDELSKKFWQILYPPLNAPSGSIEYRMSPFLYFSKKFPQLVSMIPLTMPINGELKSYNLYDWQLASLNEQISDATSMTFSDFNLSLLSTSAIHIKQNLAHIQFCISSLKNLESTIDTFAQNEAPSFTEIYSRLQSAQQILEQTQQTECLQKTTNQQVQQILEIPQAEQNQMNVEQAYETLSKISTFLEAEQPQSPAPLLIELAIKFGNKTFRELISDNNNQESSLLLHLCNLLKS